MNERPITARELSDHERRVSQKLKKAGSRNWVAIIGTSAAAAIGCGTVLYSVAGKYFVTTDSADKTDAAVAASLLEKERRLVAVESETQVIKTNVENLTATLGDVKTSVNAIHQMLLNERRERRASAESAGWRDHLPAGRQPPGR